MKPWTLTTFNTIFKRGNNSKGNSGCHLCIRQVHQHVNSIKKSRRKQIGKWAIVTSAVIGLGGVLTWQNLFSVPPSLPQSVSEVLDTNTNPYLYLEAKLQDWQDQPAVKSWREQKYNWLTWVEARSDDPWVLLRIAQSTNHIARLLGVQALTAQHYWENYQYRQVAQACDSRTLIGLARSDGVDQRYFLPPPTLHSDVPIEDDLLKLLSSLPTSGINSCIQYLTSTALRQNKAKKDKEDILYFGSIAWDFSKSPTTLTEENLERLCLDALVVHSMVASHCTEIVQHGGLQLLQRLQKARGDHPARRSVARVIGNLAVHEELHREIVQAGWVTVLAEWVNSPDLSLALHASRALVNLDRDSGERVFEDGVYLVHPRFRRSEPVYADVIFVHGLLGGPFKTWRQGQTTSSDPKPEGYTYCWPKDWLSADCPHLRIFSVEYDTNLSNWTARCPWESHIHSLQSRSRAMLEKLQTAGVGKRPIIWVGHSMGGLLIKKMIEDCAQSNDEGLTSICDNTRGFVFYSVPHRGSDLASLSKHAAFLLHPSPEVQQLYTDSPLLRSLHDGFIKFVYTHSTPCLSFGETNKTLLGMKLKTLIVPPQSSDPGIGEYHPMSTNHLDICKPDSPTSMVYQLTLAFIRTCVPENLTENILKASFSEETFGFEFDLYS